MQPNEMLPLTSRPSSPTSAATHQLDLAFDHPSLNGLTSGDREDVIVIIAQLMLEACGKSLGVPEETGDEHA